MLLLQSAAILLGAGAAWHLACRLVHGRPMRWRRTLIWLPVWALLSLPSFALGPAAPLGPVIAGAVTFRLQGGLEPGVRPAGLLREGLGGFVATFLAAGFALAVFLLGRLAT
ncbi:hypothetical protein BCF33_0966 [Hasllibacter halocynthiae]|uniref:Uncharacterized protein n=1 Tax=Hasllibacter halocynthiae TaxID=595589 RepID=A0A2T0X8S3_9RHOB|nr:hypothetical protein [Hasllibacter halocynthiae]PRY95348.1 hypothetical protein BCF33_0966 [Hasllibacter halocynthiae]